MSLASDIKSVFTADSTLMATLTGGVYTYDETGRYGISLDDTPNAYDVNGLLLPSCVVKDRSQVPDYGIVDSKQQTMSTRHIVEVWLYCHGSTSFSVLETARKRIYALLAEKRVSTNQYLCRLFGTTTLNGRDSAMGNAAWERSDFIVFTSEP